MALQENPDLLFYASPWSPPGWMTTTGDMISELTLAMVAKIRIGTIGSTIHPYPTHAEILRKAADAFNRKRLTPERKRLLTGLMSVLR